MGVRAENGRMAPTPMPFGPTCPGAALRCMGHHHGCRSARGRQRAASHTGPVRLELTHRASYAIRAVVMLARRDPRRYVPARTIAREVDIPVRFVPQVLTDLNRAGLVEARLGRSGGHRLAQPASTISLLDIIRASEGDTRRQTCVLTGLTCGTSDEPCEVHELFRDAQAAMLERLGGATVADVIAADGPAMQVVDGATSESARQARAS